MEQQIKEKIKTLVDTVTLSDPIKKVVGEFTEKYEGEYTPELVAILLALILSDTKILKDSAKVKGFEQIVDQNKEALEMFDQLDEQLLELDEDLNPPILG